MHNISIGIAILLGLAFAYLGVYVAIGRIAQEQRKRITVILCFAGSAIALLIAIYVASKS